MYVSSLPFFLSLSRSHGVTLSPVVILFLTVLNITIGASARGYKEVWNGSISDLGWYGEEAGANQAGNPYQGVPQQQYGAQPGVSYTYPNVQTFGNSQPVYQLPGHSVVITNGPNGQSSKSNSFYDWLGVEMSLLPDSLESK